MKPMKNEERKTQIGVQRAQFLFGEVRPGEDKEAFKARIKSELRHREILTPDGNLNPKLQDR